ncbi:radical SAM protein, partial [Dissulfurirhabdus thermomarina]
PVGWDPDRDEMVALDEDPFRPGAPVQAVAAFMAPAHTQTALAAFQRTRPDLAPLPLFAYTAVGWWKGRFWAAGFRSDPDPRQDPARFDPERIRRRAAAAMKAAPGNRLVQHLGKCALTYACPAARNYFLGRWEAPLPASPACNARCLGCLSLQGPGGPQRPQERIRFTPTADEIAGVAVPHLERAPRPVVSFGQGCEGEPLLQAALLEEAIRAIRARTRRGTVNLNSNASRPGAVERLAAAGLDSLRISLNSARPDRYAAYYRPVGYVFDDVVETWRRAKRAGLFVSLNYFVFPGLSDQEAEAAALEDLVGELGLDLIQLRNHNIDPDWFLEQVPDRADEPRIGVRALVRRLAARFPALRIGYFNPCLDALPAPGLRPPA